MDELKLRGRKDWLLVFLVLITNISLAQSKQTFEAEAAVLSGTAEVASCPNASGGEMVKRLDNGENIPFYLKK